MAISRPLVLAQFWVKFYSASASAENSLRALEWVFKRSRPTKTKCFLKGREIAISAIFRFWSNFDPKTKVPEKWSKQFFDQNLCFKSKNLAKITLETPFLGQVWKSFRGAIFWEPRNLDFHIKIFDKICGHLTTKIGSKTKLSKIHKNMFLSQIRPIEHV